MQILVGILFYLGVITGPASYTQCEWDLMLEDNSTDIENVQNDQAAMQVVNSSTPPSITIFNDCGEEL